MKYILPFLLLFTHNLWLIFSHFYKIKVFVNCTSEIILNLVILLLTFFFLAAFDEDVFYSYIIITVSLELFNNSIKIFSILKNKDKS